MAIISRFPGGGGSSGDYPYNVASFSASALDDSITLTWTDPADVAWAGTKIIRKVGAYPADVTDGVQIMDSKIKNQYQTTGLADAGLADGVTYYYQAFPYSDNGVSNNVVNRVSATPEYIYPSAMAAFAAQAGNQKAKLVFTLPGDATGVKVVYKAGGYPTSQTDGTVIASAVSGQEITGLTNDTAYYFRAFPFNSYGRYNEETQGNQATCTPVATQSYGVQWAFDNSSSALTRLGAAASFAAPSPAVGTGAGSSPFDACLPWSGIRECNVVSGVVTAYKGDANFSRTAADVMVEIPKFWYKCTNNAATSKREWWIADGPADGFVVHPAFIRGGVEKEHIYVGRYATSGSANAQVSKSGVTHLTGITRAAFRGSSAATGAKQKGAGWSQWDIATWNALQMLYLVEFADFNAQAKIGRGYCDGNITPISAGGTDGMSYHTGRPAGTDGKTAVQYRGIENLWGNIWQFVDGYNINNAVHYFCTDQSKFADDTASNYTQMGYNTTGKSDAYISALGFDANNPWLQAPTAAAGSEITYITDRYWYNTGWRVLLVGGRLDNASGCGVFCWFATHASSFANADLCSRLLKI